MQQYLDLLSNILATGVEKKDRTGTGTVSLFGNMLRFDLSQGYPLVTTKKIHFKSILYELLWMLRGETNIKWLNENGVTIWNEWIAPNHNVGGPSSHRPLIWVPEKKFEPVPAPASFSTRGLNAQKSSIDDKLRGVWAKIMGRCYNPDHHNYRFYGAKGISVSSRWHDPRSFVEDVQKLPNWENKLKSWNQYELDKDYFSSNLYSADSCVWLHTAENNYYTASSKPFSVSAPGETPNIYLTLSQAENDLDIARSTLCRWLNLQSLGEDCSVKGDNSRFKDWTFKYLENPGHALRMAFSDGDLGPIYGRMWRDWGGQHIDQIAEAHKLLRSDPFSRRIMVSAWNVAELPLMRLQPCHYNMQFEVHEDKRRPDRMALSCKMDIRSWDVFLGGPFNIGQYALLTMMMAHIHRFTYGDLVISSGDTHLYLNHRSQANLQLLRKPLNLPLIRFSERANHYKYVWEFQPEDVSLLGYNSHPHIKAEVAV